VADERMSDGEIVRRFERLERDLGEANRQALPINVYEARHAAMVDRMTAIETAGKERHKSVMEALGELKKQQAKRSELTVGRLISVLAIGATLLVGFWSIFGRAH
jgi:hypothetical protein